MEKTLEHTAITHNEGETMEFGRALVSQLTPPVCVLLTGDLGAGKTTLTKGIAEGMGSALRENVTSPTFTLIHEYRGAKITVYHIDLYRIETERELETLGLGELMAQDAILLIEWGEKFSWLVERCDIRIVIEIDGEDGRKISVSRKK
jgi:tRNA threonylcarbamoyladenosine biosynthesis protein TsaE